MCLSLYYLFEVAKDADTNGGFVCVFVFVGVRGGGRSGI